MKAMFLKLISVVLNSMSLLTYFTEPFGNKMRNKTKCFHLQLMRTYKSVTDLCTRESFVSAADILIFSLEHTPFVHFAKKHVVLFRTHLMIHLIGFVVFRTWLKAKG